MKSTEIEIAFPVLGFTPDLENWGFPDLNRLTKCGTRTLKENKQDGMEIIDAKGRCWRVLSIRRIGRAGSVLNLIPGFGPPQFRIEQELEALPPVPLAELKRRARASMENFQVDYMGFDGDEEAFADRMRRLEAAASYAELYDVVGADTFEPY